MPKSEFKLLVAEMTPESVQSAKSPNIPAAFPVILDDTIVRLTKLIQSLAKSVEMYTADDIVRVLYDPIVATAKHVPCYVSIFDKYTHVTPAKQAEQRSRDQKNKQEEAKESAFQCEQGLRGKRKLAAMVEALTKVQPGTATASTQSYPGGDLHPNFGGDLPLMGLAWRKAFTSDRKLKHFLVRLVMQRAVQVVPEMMRRAGTPAHHRIILDGELVTGDAAIRACGPEPPTAADTVMETELANQLGEFDVAHQHHLQCPSLQQLVASTPGASFCVETVDTDILVINAQRSSDPCYPQEVRIAMGMPKRACVGGVPVDPSCKYYFDPHRVRAWADSLLRDTEAGFAGLVEVFHLAGSDFSSGIPGVSSLTVLKDFLLYAQHNPSRSVRQFYEHKLSQQQTKYIGVKNASGRTLTMKRKLDHMTRTAEHPLKRVRWVQEDYWSGRNQQSPSGRGYAIDAWVDAPTSCASTPNAPTPPKAGMWCFAEDLVAVE